MPSDALDHITIKGFKSIASIEKLDLRPINILIGANGAGKSNVLGAMSFLREVAAGRLTDYVGRSAGANRILHFGPKTTSQLEFDLSFAGGQYRYHLELKSNDENGLYPAMEWATLQNQGFDALTEHLSSAKSGRETGLSNTNPGFSRWVHDRLDQWAVYHLHDTTGTSPLRIATSSLNDNRSLRADGANLPSFLYLLRAKFPEDYNLICSTVHQVAPFFGDFALRPLELNEDILNLDWTHARSNEVFGASAFSDGTLRFIFLTALFMQPVKYLPPVILVDEPELGLHPFAITLLASLIQYASKQTQVIVSTQSSLLLDHFEPADVLVTERVNGATQIRRLTPEPLEVWLKDYSLGQLWEKNEFGGKPVPD